jgi:hypothetical protein
MVGRSQSKRHCPGLSRVASAGRPVALSDVFEKVTYPEEAGTDVLNLAATLSRRHYVLDIFPPSGATPVKR